MIDTRVKHAPEANLPALCGLIAISSPALAQRLPVFEDCDGAVQSIEKTPRLDLPDAQTRK
ncbi:hypothetical protein [Caballeronia sp. RCC_10]|uniref:hypothetical protein n=1 Tax=Caballeronia sp. RCC_10 TaxID=3239227 RepID=UPI0035251E69